MLKCKKGEIKDQLSKETIISTIRQTTDCAVPEKSGRNYDGGPIRKADKLM